MSSSVLLDVSLILHDGLYRWGHKGTSSSCFWRIHKKNATTYLPSCRFQRVGLSVRDKCLMWAEKKDELP